MRPTRFRGPFAVAALAVALVLGAGVGAATYSLLSDPTTVVREVTVTDSEPAATASGLSVGEIYRRSQASVVEVTATGTSPQFGSPRRQYQGSGFVYDRDGHIVTNQHVVAQGDTITVRFSDGSTHRAEVVGTDPSTDLAVIRVDAPASLLRPLQLGDSSAVEVGDGVVAIGSPFGLEGTVTSGIVSALHRQITAPNNFTITNAIQTDAAINHGNSGGPLIDGSGRVIGINAQIESESGGSDGVGFAIPSSTVRSIVRQLVESGSAEHAYLGVTLVTVPEGVAVTNVRQGTPAARAGLRPATRTRTVDGQELPTGGDVIVAFDGKAIESAEELQSAVDANRPGDRVSITVLRNGARKTLQVTLGTRPASVGG